MFKKTILTLMAILIIPLIASANLISNYGFETSSSPLKWTGDTFAIVGDQDGITPYEGSYMLQFLNTGATASEARYAEVWQIIDLSDFDYTSSLKATASAYFNRIPSESLYTSQSDYESLNDQFGIYVYTITGNSDIGWTYNFLSKTKLSSDNNPDTWENLTLNFSIPDGVNLLSFCIYARENYYNTTTGIEFEGHYADNISLDIAPAPVPEPATMLLFGTGMIGLAGLRKKHRKS